MKIKILSLMAIFLFLTACPTPKPPENGTPTPTPTVVPPTATPVPTEPPAPTPTPIVVKPTPIITPIPTPPPIVHKPIILFPSIYDLWWLVPGDKAAYIISLEENNRNYTNVMFTWVGQVKFKITAITERAAILGSISFDTYNIEACTSSNVTYKNGECSGATQLNNFLKLISDTYSYPYTLKITHEGGKGKIFFYATVTNKFSGSSYLFTQFRYTVDNQVWAQTGQYGSGKYNNTVPPVIEPTPTPIPVKTPIVTPTPRPVQQPPAWWPARPDDVPSTYVYCPVPGPGGGANDHWKPLIDCPYDPYVRK
jgi:hypothetical protein